MIRVVAGSLVIACSTVASPAAASETQELRSFVDQWARAWEHHTDLANYESLYAQEFNSAYMKMNREQWLANKQKKAAKARCIKVELDDITVSQTGGEAEIRFSQTYATYKYCDEGEKVLRLRRIADRWKIISEEQPKAQRCGMVCRLGPDRSGPPFLQYTSLEEALSKPRRVKSVSLAAKGLTTVPKSIAKLENLERLYLKGNKLREIPSSLFTLARLKTLDVSSNEISAVPPSIVGLHDLEYLNLGGNELVSIPSTINQLKSLRTLDVSNCGLQVLPETLGSMSNLQTLRASRNQLSHLPKSLVERHSNVSVDISYNHFSENEEQRIKRLMPNITSNNQARASNWVFSPKGLVLHERRTQGSAEVARVPFGAQVERLGPLPKEGPFQRVEWQGMQGWAHHTNLATKPPQELKPLIPFDQNYFRVEREKRTSICIDKSERKDFRLSVSKKELRLVTSRGRLAPDAVKMAIVASMRDRKDRDTVRFVIETGNGLKEVAVTKKQGYYLWSGLPDEFGVESGAFIGSTGSCKPRKK